MDKHIGKLSTDELNNLLKAETNRFKRDFDAGVPFNELKKIRVLLRAIEEELKKRK